MSKCANRLKQSQQSLNSVTKGYVSLVSNMFTLLDITTSLSLFLLGHVFHSFYCTLLCECKKKKKE